MRDKPGNLRQRYLEIWDRGIKGVELCYSTGCELGSLIVKKRWKLCEALQWQLEAIFGEFKSWGEVCNLKEQWRGHLFVTKPDVTAAYTSNRGADWRIVMYTVITHTHIVQTAIHCTHNGTLPGYVHEHTNSGSAGLTGYSSCGFPHQTIVALLQARQARLCQENAR